MNTEDDFKDHPKLTTLFSCGPRRCIRLSAIRHSEGTACVYLEAYLSASDAESLTPAFLTQLRVLNYRDEKLNAMDMYDLVGQVVKSRLGEALGGPTWHEFLGNILMGADHINAVLGELDAAAAEQEKKA